MASHWCSSQERSDEAVVVHLIGCRGALDAHTVEAVQDRLFALAAEPSACDLVLDLRNIEFISARTISLLLSLRDRLRAAGRRLIVQNVRAFVHDVLRRVEVDQLFDLRPSSHTEPAPLGAPAVLCPPGRARSRNVFVIIAGAPKATVALPMIRKFVNYARPVQKRQRMN
jgi:anti-anti-sigma factor